VPEKRDELSKENVGREWRKEGESCTKGPPAEKQGDGESVPPEMTDPQRTIPGVGLKS